MPFKLGASGNVNGRPRNTGHRQKLFNDLVLPHREKLISQAIENTRLGAGPCLIEALTYRLCDHTTADDARRYVDPEEHATALQQEPIAKLQTHLKSLGLWSEEQEILIQQECRDLVAQAAQEYLNTPDQAPESILDYLYAKLPASLELQREELLHGVS